MQKFNNIHRMGSNIFEKTERIHVVYKNIKVKFTKILNNRNIYSETSVNKTSLYINYILQLTMYNLIFRAKWKQIKFI